MCRSLFNQPRLSREISCRVWVLEKSVDSRKGGRGHWAINGAIFERSSHASLIKIKSQGEKNAFKLGNEHVMSSFWNDKRIQVVLHTVHVDGGVLFWSTPWKNTELTQGRVRFLEEMAIDIWLLVKDTMNAWDKALKSRSADFIDPAFRWGLLRLQIYLVFCNMMSI